MRQAERVRGYALTGTHRNASPFRASLIGCASQALKPSPAGRDFRRPYPSTDARNRSTISTPGSNQEPYRRRPSNLAYTSPLSHRMGKASWAQDPDVLWGAIERETASWIRPRTLVRR